MRPTFSIIAFTVLSGIGYGAWFLEGIGLALGMACRAPASGDASLRACRFVFFDGTALALALLFVVAGLLASLGHLGKPTRAWRALSQWRTSWLSREGVAALLTFVPATILLLQHGLVVLDGSAQVTPHGWNADAWGSTWQPLLGGLLAVGACATVVCTANIYASLKPVPAWSDRHVVPGYLLLALLGGSALLLACGPLSAADRRTLVAAIIVLSIACAWLKLRYWRAIDAQSAPDPGRATGLSAFGEVHAIEAPHTEQNYLTHEMGFVLARKHARRLRRIALILACGVPALLAALSFAVPGVATAFAGIGFVAVLAGLLVERWLFFAEARHAVIAYYAR